jgi:hypothetical protein
MGGIPLTSAKLDSTASLTAILGQLQTKVGKGNPGNKSSGILGQLSMFDV